MKQLVEYIVSNLVNHPEDVVIEEQSTDGSDFTLINIQVNPEDIGRVIGKSGKVIKAIRQITRIAAIQKGLKIRVDLIDQDAPPPQTETEVPQTESPDAKTEAPQAETVDAKTEAPQTESPYTEVKAPQTETVETEIEVPQTETVDKDETGKQVYPEPETLETEPKKETK